MAGMYGPVSDIGVAEAVALLADTNRLADAMDRVVTAWRHATEHNLTDRVSNRRAWLGQAACAIECGVTEASTRAAWGVLTQQHRDEANAVADRVISRWDSGGLGCQRDIWKQTS